jgi:hypothetical protein
MSQSKNKQSLDQLTQNDIIKIVRSLKEFRLFIFGLTGIVTLLAILYLLNLPAPQYKAETSFVSPNESSMVSLNNVIDHFEGDRWKAVSKDEIFASFLKNLSIKELQKKVFYDNDYVAILNLENQPTVDV